MAYEESEKKSGLVEEIKRNLKLAQDAEGLQREREREDLRFQVPEYQWDDDARRARQGGVLGAQITPGRPMLSISLLTQPMQLIRNQAANARLGVEVHPVSEEAEDEVAEILQGLYRRIERDSNAEVARLWALDRAVQAGRGWYRVNTKYDEDAENPFDQEITIDRILDQNSVYMDPASQKADFSDARWGMIVTWVPLSTLEKEFPDIQFDSGEMEFSNWMTEDPNWVKVENGEKAVLVAESFYKTVTKKEKKIKGQKRSYEEVEVKYCKVTSRDVLEEAEWNGKYIPIIPVLGRELQMFDGDRRWEGMVRQARDGQKLFNYSASTLAERLALEPKAPFIGAEGQFEDHEDEWAQANVRNLPYLEYKPTSHDGNLNPPPARAVIDTQGTSLAMQALMQAKSFIQASTSVYDPSLGEMPENREGQSGRAILALQQQADAGTGHFLQSLAKVSMMYEARVILDLIPKIYDRPGRITQILGDEEEPEMVMLNRPFIKGPNGRPQSAPPPGMPPSRPGAPVPTPPPGAMPPRPAMMGPPQGPMNGPQGPGMPPGAPPGPPGMPPPQPIVQKQPEPKMYDLKKGTYMVAVTVGKSFQTRLQEGQAEIGGILERAPQLMPIIGDLYFRFRDFPGSREIAERLAKVREKTMPGIGDDEDEGMTLQQAQVEIQKLQQGMQQTTMMLQQAMQQIQTDQAKQQATLQKAQMDNQTKMLIAKLDAQTKLMQELIKGKARAAEKQMDAEEKELDRQHEADGDMFEADHETAMAIITKEPDLELEEQETKRSR